MIGIIIVTVTSLILGSILVLTDNNSDEEILEALPGLNCGACGFGSCKGMVEAIKEDKYNYEKCKPLRKENRKRLEEILDIK